MRKIGKSLAMIKDATTAVILAGGRSLRFGGEASVTKPAILIERAPMVLHAAAKLVAEGATRIFVLTGRNHCEVQAALGMTQNQGNFSDAMGRRFSIELRFSGDDAGTAGRLLVLDSDEIGPGAFLTYTDVFTDAQLCSLRLRADDGACLNILTASPPLPWGVVQSTGQQVTEFQEKPVDHGLRINAGFYFFNPSMLDYIRHPSEMLEQEPINRMVKAGVVRTVHHSGAWVSIDSPKDIPTEGDALFNGLRDAPIRPEVPADNGAEKAALNS